MVNGESFAPTPVSVEVPWRPLRQFASNQYRTRKNFTAAHSLGLLCLPPAFLCLPWWRIKEIPCCFIMVAFVLLWAFLPSPTDMSLLLWSLILMRWMVYFLWTCKMARNFTGHLWYIPKRKKEERVRGAQMTREING